MQDFPQFMKSPKNRIARSSQHTQDIEGYVFDGADGSQMAFWTCYADRVSETHTHPYDEYTVCVHGQYTIRMNGESFVLKPGDELHVPKHMPHSGECIAGTRTIHMFGGRRAEREK